MLEFMREGGWGMWAVLLVAVGSAVAAVSRRNEGGARTAAAGAIAAVAFGLLGFATGLYNVLRAVGAAPAAEKTEWLVVGLGEAIHNVALSGIAALLLVGVAAAVARAGERPASAPAAEPRRGAGPG